MAEVQLKDYGQIVVDCKSGIAIDVLVKTLGHNIDMWISDCVLKTEIVTILVLIASRSWKFAFSAAILEICSFPGLNKMLFCSKAWNQLGPSSSTGMTDSEMPQKIPIYTIASRLLKLNNMKSSSQHLTAF